MYLVRSLSLQQTEDAWSTAVLRGYTARRKLSFDNGHLVGFQFLLPIQSQKETRHFTIFFGGGRRLVFRSLFSCKVLSQTQTPRKNSDLHLLQIHLDLAS